MTDHAVAAVSDAPTLQPVWALALSGVVAADLGDFAFGACIHVVELPVVVFDAPGAVWTHQYDVAVEDQLAEFGHYAVFSGVHTVVAGGGHAAALVILDGAPALRVDAAWVAAVRWIEKAA